MCKVVCLSCLFYGCADPKSAVRLLSFTVLTSAICAQGCMSLLFVSGCGDPTSDVREFSCTELTSTVRVQSCTSLLFVLRLCRPYK